MFSTLTMYINGTFGVGNIGIAVLVIFRSVSLLSNACNTFIRTLSLLLVLLTSSVVVFTSAVFVNATEFIPSGIVGAFADINISLADVFASNLGFLQVKV